ncbi:MAG TPA: energy-coupling factor transporter transmembrane component T [Candidatus Limnocylindria bacterium]|nr:energy-coupling factor transporter transmembrane component T [Candidatus Limnocylindria bacterium]
MLELQRNVIFGQYIETGSLIHRLDPRIKIVAMWLFVIFSFLVELPGLLLALPLLVLIHAIAGIPFRYILTGSRVFLLFLAVIAVFQILFYRGAFAEQNVFWEWWIVSVSLEGILFAVMISLRVIVLYYVVTMLMLTTSLVDLTDGLELMFLPLQRVRVPVNELTLVSVIAIKFVPIFIGEMERLARAQTARGVPFEEGGPIARARRVGQLLIPIFLSGFRRADLLTMAMDTRCYQGGANRTKFRRMSTTSTDWLALGFVALWLIAAWQTPGLIGWHIP